MSQIKLIIDSPQKNSSLIYAAGHYSLDPYIFIEHNDKKIGWLPSTELEKAKLISKMDIVNNLSDEYKKILENNKYPLLKSSVIIDWLKNNDIKEITVPESFPLIEYENLKKFGFKIYCIKEPFYERRVSKTDHEINFVKDNTKKNEAVLQSVYEILASSDITNDKKLQYKGSILTSEFLQNFILKSFIDNELTAEDVIVSIGNQGCYPHEHGYGEITAHTSIIIDVYPRSRKNLYFTDMTRTFCKGKASDDLKKIYSSVLEAQKIGFDKIHAREEGKKVHESIMKYFDENGYKTGIINGILQGFIHGTGHGLGLDCHELPSISLNGTVLPENSIVSVEPGLYYLDIGAVRIEDLVVVKKDGIENLNSFHKIFEIS